MDKSLAVVTLEDMKASGGKSQDYWLLAVRKAWVAKASAEVLAAADTMPD
jgi:hypothetical protein